MNWIYAGNIERPKQDEEVLCCDNHGEMILGYVFEDETSDTGFSAGNTFGGMVVLWPVIVPILAVAKLFDIVFQIGDKLSRKILGD